jgi:hypothetical protein
MGWKHSSTAQHSVELNGQRLKTLPISQCALFVLLWGILASTTVYLKTISVHDMLAMASENDKI